jgi:hypothetical protein
MFYFLKVAYFSNTYYPFQHFSSPYKKALLSLSLQMVGIWKKSAYKGEVVFSDVMWYV